MKYVPRLLEGPLVSAARDFPALILTGPRRAGKTTLLRRLFPRARYRLLEDPDVLERARSDPRSFLDELAPPVILDEIQNVPELFSYIRSRIDAEPGRKGRYFLTGSQDAPLMRGVSESMAGRAAVFQLWPLALQESPSVTLLKGGFPEVLARPRSAEAWFRSYVRTYLERDVRSLTAVRDLGTFRRFVSLVASRSGQILNRTELAAGTGVSLPTVSEWLAILETTCQIQLVSPFYENFGKRLVKSPKLYWTDPGLACHLLGIDSEAALRASSFLGPIFEGWIASEMVKLQLGAGRRAEIYCFRDRLGLEVDFVVPLGAGRLALLEVKASATLKPEAGAGVARLRGSIRRRDVHGFVVHRPPPGDPPLRALLPGVSAIGVDGLREALELPAAVRRPPRVPPVRRSRG
jgi:hypothetical protein